MKIKAVVSDSYEILSQKNSEAFGYCFRIFCPEMRKSNGEAVSETYDRIGYALKSKIHGAIYVFTMSEQVLMSLCRLVGTVFECEDFEVLLINSGMFGEPFEKHIKVDQDSYLIKWEWGFFEQGLPLDDEEILSFFKQEK